MDTLTSPSAWGKPVIALTGPTACGKTAAALAIAQAMPVEIISVDSALVYRGMDIGTAKPSLSERASVPHHLIDILDPAQAYSAASFVRDAGRLIGEIQGRDRLPLLVGGTMLYLKSLLVGLDEMPPANPQVRAEIEMQAREHGWAYLYAELSRIDPTTAERLAPADSQRIQRALEVYRVTGQPLSKLHGQRATQSGSDTAITLISLEPQNRPWLHDRIAERFDAMLAMGFLDEVRALKARPDLSADMPAMRCVGYRQAWEALEGKIPISELRDRGVFATRQLAKRQITWLRSMPERLRVDCDQSDAIPRVLALARAASSS